MQDSAPHYEGQYQFMGARGGRTTDASSRGIGGTFPNLPYANLGSAVVT
jgi:hypothetical protein